MTDYTYYDGGAAGFAFAAMFLMFTFAFALVFYVINSIFLMKLLKNAGHAHPGAAWVPLWNTVVLFELGGIRTPWIWVIILFAGGALSAIPILGFIISIALLVASIMLVIWMAKGVQMGLGLESTGGIVLAIFIPFAWVIWMAIRSDKVKYSVHTAVREGGTFPLNWFGEGNPYASFPVVNNGGNINI